MKKVGRFIKLTLGVAFAVSGGIGGLVAQQQASAATVPQTRVIIGDDDRVQIMDTTVSPYQSIGYILANGHISTGTVIGKNTVVTAGHVGNSIGEEPSQDIDEVYFAPGRNDEEYPFGKFKIKAMYQLPDYIDNPGAESDLAVLILDTNEAGESVGDLVTPMPIKVTGDIAIGTPLTTTGYPGDRVYGTMWTNSGQVVKQTDSLIYYDMDTAGGQSGSPVYNDQNQMDAVHGGGTQTANLGVKLNAENYQFILDHLQ